MRVWTVYNPNRSMLGLVLANALDLAYKGLDFERRNILLIQLVYTELCKFCPRLQYSLQFKSLHVSAGPALLIERWICSRFCPFKHLPGPV